MRKLFISLMATLGICTGCTAQSGVKVLEPEEFIAAAKADTTAVLLDVRRATEFAEGHIEGAVNLDWLDTEAFAKGMARLDTARTYYIYCRSGRRSNAAATKMQAAGMKVYDMKGGILRWTELGLPTVGGR